MSILFWILFGLAVGALAKWILPGNQPGGWLQTMIIGILGSFLGGFLGTFLGLGSVTGFNPRSLIIATGGAVLLLWIQQRRNAKK